MRIVLILMIFVLNAYADDGASEAARIYTFEREQALKQGKKLAPTQIKKDAPTGEEIFITDSETTKIAHLAISLKGMESPDDENADEITIRQGPTKIYVHSRIQGENYENSYFVVIKGRFTDSRKTLIYSGKILEVDSKGRFEFRHYIRQDEENFMLSVVGLKKEVREYLVHSDSPGFAAFAEENRTMKPKRNFINVSLGATSMSYHETGRGSLPEMATTFKAMYNFILASNWDVGFSGYVTAFQLTGDPLKYRFLGLNARVGRVYMADEKGRWRFLLMGGFYYLTMFTKDNAFGFVDVGGPQVFPSLRHTLNNGDVVGTYFKFSPITNQLGFLDITSREIATGVSYTFTETMPKTVSLDIAFLNVRVPDHAGTLQSLSLSYGVGL